jgi:hypothetical protein
VALPHSGEQLRATESGEKGNKGCGGLVTSSPQGESLGPLNGDKGTVMARVDDGATAAAWMEVQ